MTVQAVTNTPAILAVDPGKTTGWARYWEGHMESGQVEGRHAFYDWVAMTAGAGHPLELVVESFTITARTMATDRDMNALYIIGWLDGMAYRLGWPITLQQPGAAKGFASNEKLAVLGWRRPTPGGHADDAARHLLTYLGTKRRDLGEPLLRTLIERGLS